MVRRFIAGLLLWVVAAWAEVLVAPMLTIHALAHPVHAMAQPMAVHHHAMPATHPCCPGLQAATTAPMVEFAAASLPCADEHRCCFRQGPQSAPAPAQYDRKPSPEVDASQTVALKPACPALPVESLPVALASSPPTTFGMILRI
jgi:uncharacterized protein involved in copper resistance